jgi:hypothetical protein
MSETSEGSDRVGGTAQSSAFLVALAWIGVGAPMLWGVWMTLKKATLLFR